MKYDEHIAEVIKENSKWNLGELITAFKEIEVAAAADKTGKGKKFPALTTIAATIRKREFDRLTPEVWESLADFLEGKHRGNIRVNVLDAQIYNEITEYQTAEILKKLKAGLSDKVRGELLKTLDPDSELYRGVMERKIDFAYVDENGSPVYGSKLLAEIHDWSTHGLPTKAIGHLKCTTIEARDLHRRMKRYKKTRLEAVRLQMEDEKNTPESVVLKQLEPV